MRSAACLTLLLSSAVQALLPSVAAPRFSLAPTRAGAVTMAGPVALAKKTAVLEEVRSVMAESQLMFCVRSEGLKVNEINNLRMKLPEGVQLKCVKNTLVNIASKEYEQFNADDIGGLLHYSNYWFFASEDKMRVSLQIWEDFRKATSKKVRPTAARSLPRRSPRCVLCAQPQPTHRARLVRRSAAD